MRITRVKNAHGVFDGWLIKPDTSDGEAALEFLMKALEQTYGQMAFGGSTQDASSANQEPLVDSNLPNQSQVRQQ